MMMIQEYTNVNGNEIILVITKKATRKWGWWWFKNTKMLLVINYLGNYKGGDNKVRVMMIQEYRNVIGK